MKDCSSKFGYFKGSNRRTFEGMECTVYKLKNQLLFFLLASREGGST